MTRFRLTTDRVSEPKGTNRLVLTLHNLGSEPVSGFRLAFTSLIRIKIGTEVANGTVVDQVANYHVIEPPAGLVLAPGGSWQISADQLSHQFLHYNYGPKSAALYLADGTIEPIEVAIATDNGAEGLPQLSPPARTQRPEDVPPISVIPFPASVSVADARPLPSAISFAAGPSAARLAYEAVSGLARRLFPNETLFGVDGLPVLVETGAVADDGGYVLDFTPNAVALRAGGALGFRYGFITLAQILRGARLHPEDFSFPLSGTIADAPRFEWRGAHLDVSRQLYSLDELSAVLDCMAWNKLNRFHFHLNDDEGWRIAVPAYPAVAEKAAFRGPGETTPPLFGSPFARYGLVYAPEDIKALVRHGQDVGIEIVPEIDMPGHSYGLLQSLPDLADPDETGIYRAVQYYPNNALNPAHEPVYAFVQAVLETLVELFPAPWIHIGGDEVSEQAWSHSPLAQKLMAEQGWTDTFQLQSHFLKRVQAMVRALGKKTGAWEEAAYGGGVDQSDSYLVVWTRSEPGRELAEKGYEIVMAPAEHVYFDMAQADAFFEPGAAWASTVSLETCYGFDPGHDWTEEARKHLVGVQSCLWSENLHDKALFTHMMYPRLSALAETAWTPRSDKNFARFSAIQSLMPKS